MRLDLLGNSQGFVKRHRLHSLFAKALDGVGVFSQVELGANQDDGNIGSVVANLWVPLQ